MQALNAMSYCKLHETPEYRLASLRPGLFHL